MEMPRKFSKPEVRELFKEKKVVFLGDSILREIYKDLIWLDQRGSLIHHDQLKFVPGKDDFTVQESFFSGERLVPGTGKLKEKKRKSKQLCTLARLWLKKFLDKVLSENVVKSILD